jgi:hypothetical protein
MARAQKPDRYELPVVGPAFMSRELELSSQVTKNLFPEINQEARSVIALHNTAGLNTFSTLEGVDRGLHDFHGFMHGVNGTSLWSVDADGVNLNLGTIGGSARCVMADDGTQLVIVSDGLAYIYTNTGGLQLITDPDLVEPTSVAYLNSIFVFDQNRGTFGEWVSSELLTTGFNVAELDFAQAEGHPDDIVRVFSFKQMVYFYGSKSIEPWYNSGEGNPPFQRVTGGVVPYGLAGIHAVVSTSEYMYFLDDKRIPRRSSGLDFQNIGNSALGVEFSKYGTVSDVIAYTFVQDHQVFFALTFPTEDRTWCFHEPSASWFQLSYGVNDARHRASSMLDIYGLNYCADHSNGLIYHYDPCTYTDNGEPIQRRRDTALIHGGLFQQPGRRMFIEEVEFIVGAGACEVKGTGMGPQPGYVENTYTSWTYPIDAQDSMQMTTAPDSGTLDLLPHSELQSTETLEDGAYTQVRWFFSDGPYDSDLQSTQTLEDGTYVQVRWFFEDGPYDSDLQSTQTLLDGTYESKLIEADSPDEKLQMAIVINATSTMDLI